MEGMFALLGLALTGWIKLGMSFVGKSSSWRFPLALPSLSALMVMDISMALLSGCSSQPQSEMAPGFACFRFHDFYPVHYERTLHHETRNFNLES